MTFGVRAWLWLIPGNREAVTKCVIPEKKERGNPHPREAKGAAPGLATLAFSWLLPPAGPKEIGRQ